MKTLNNDILHEIITHIPQQNRQITLLNLSLVNRFFYHTSRPIVFASVKWPHPDQTDDSGLSFFAEKLWGYFKIFCLDWPVVWSECNPPLWGYKNGTKYTPIHLDKLETALPFMPNLHTFQMTCPFDPPLSFFQVLRGCTSIKDLRITDTPVWDALEDSDAPILFTAERMSFSPVGEGARMGDGPTDKKFHDFESYKRVEYRLRYYYHILQRENMIPPGLPFLLRCRTETATHLQLSGDYYSLDDFTNSRLSFPVLETLILTGPCPRVAPGSMTTLPEVISYMPRLRDLRVLLVTRKSCQPPLFMVPYGLSAPLAVYRQLIALAMSNDALGIERVLRYADSLQRLAISAISRQSGRPVALPRSEVGSVLDKIREGGGGKHLKQFRIMSKDAFAAAFVIRLNEVCPCLEFVELEVQGCMYCDDEQPWEVVADAFAQYCHLKELRIGMRLPTCEHDFEYLCTPCMSSWFHHCALGFAQRILKLQRIGLEYATRRKYYEDRWMDFDIMRVTHGEPELVPLPTTWYEFPEVWERTTLEE